MLSDFARLGVASRPAGPVDGLRGGCRGLSAAADNQKRRVVASALPVRAGGRRLGGAYPWAVVPPEPRPLLVFVASGDRFARAGLEAMLSRAGFEPGEAVDADVVVYDAGEGPSFPAFTVPTVVLALDEEGADSALAAGARGAVMRGAADARIVAAVHGVAAGLLVVDVEFSAAIVKPRGPRPGMERLTTR